jgi:hypothetical protein
MASEEDIAHFAAVAAAKVESEIERLDAALRTPAGERMLLGVALGLEGPWTAAHLAEMDARTDGEMELARRRIALALPAPHGD